MCASGGKPGGRIVRPWYGGGPVAQQNRMTGHAYPHQATAIVVKRVNEGDNHGP
jgi:hypothetical protein